MEGRPPAPLSIVDFMTDGALAALCAELSGLIGVRIELRDPQGRTIVAGEGDQPWRVGPSPGETTDTSVSLKASGEIIGTLAISGKTPELGSHARERLERALELLASTVNEVCERELELRHRLKEISVLYRLSSMLARAASVDAMTSIALDSSIDVLELSSGSIVLFEESTEEAGLSPSEKDLVLKAHRNLSMDWLTSPLPLSHNRVFDRLALEGQVVTVEDLQADDRVAIRERAQAEGLRSFINAGLVFQDKPIGVIRLYGREPRRFSQADQRLLRSIAQQLAVAVEQARLLRVQEHDDRIQRQLQLAVDVQRRMLPASVPSVPGLEFAAKWTTSLELGGDFYDFIDLHGSVGVVVGDVVGKGIAAAVLMSAVRAFLRAHSIEGRGPHAVMSRLNSDLCRDTLPEEFATVFLAHVDPGSRVMTFCSGGHDPAILVRPSTTGGPPEVHELRQGGGLVVGVDAAQTYEKATVQLHAGDVLVVYTDGIVDARSFSSERFGRPRLRASLSDLLTERPQASAGEVLERVFRDLRQFAGLAARPDDQTLVVMRVKGT